MQFNIMSFNLILILILILTLILILFQFTLISKDVQKKGTAAPPTRERKDATPPKERGESSTHQLHYLNLFQVIEQNPRWGITGGFCLWAAQVNPQKLGSIFRLFCQLRI